MTHLAALTGPPIARKFLESTLVPDIATKLYRKGLTATAFHFSGDDEDLEYLSATVDMVGQHTKQADTMPSRPTPCSCRKS